ncbi:MAG TPA: hypothetical protein VF377_08960 [Acidimicrobiia bacterium]
MRTVRFYFGQNVFVVGLIRALLEEGLIGGATQLTGYGFWLSDTGRLDYEEAHVMVTTYDSEDTLELLKKRATEWALKAREEAVMVEVGDVVEFLDTGYRKPVAA